MKFSENVIHFLTVFTVFSEYKQNFIYLLLYNLHDCNYTSIDSIIYIYLSAKLDNKEQKSVRDFDKAFLFRCYEYFLDVPNKTLWGKSFF